MPKRSINQSQLDGAGSKRRRQSQAHSGGVDKISGIIKKVELRNFMNHAYLTFDFQPRVNFVTGRNGTGKSALLTGLMVGLGGKASATNRGSQLAGFIQYGKNIAEIKVTLSNEGVDAYHPELYGDSIVVERKLTRSGGGSDYKIKTSSGRMVSTKKADLSRILDYFNIQVENPVAILNQETSKSFLCSKNPADVYKFFTKATQLEQMQLHYDTATSEFNKSMETLRSKESSLPTLKHELKLAEEREAALQSLDKLRNKLANKQCELAWSVVQQKESVHEKLEKQVEAIRKKQPKYVEQHKKALEEVEKAKEGKNEIEERIKAMAGDAETLEPRRGELKKELNNKKQISRAKFQAAEQIKKEIRGIESEKKIMEDRVKDIQSNSQDDRSVQIKERDEKVERLTNKFRDIEQNHANVKAQMNRASQSLSTLTEKRNEFASNVGELERLKKKHQARISELEKARKNKTARFGRNVPALQEEIERLWKAGKFQKKPFGPLGQHITMKDMRYVLGAEKALGSLMTAFLVDNKYDRAVLDAAKRKVYGQERGPPFVVLQYTERRHDIRRDRAHTDNPTLSDLLEIDNDIVFNTIVDEANPQNIVMVLDIQQARNLMMNNPPKNCSVCYNGRGDQLNPKPFREYGNREKHPRFLSASVEEDIRVETQALRSVSQELTDTQKKLDRVKLDIQSTSSEHTKLKGQVNTFDKHLRKLQADINELNNQEFEEEATEDADTLLEDIRGFVEEIGKLTENYQEAKSAYEASRAEEKAVEQQLADILARIREVNLNIDPLKAELNKAEEDIDTANNAVAHYQKSLTEYDARLQAKENEANKFYEEEVERGIGQASQMSQRVEAKKSPQILQAEIQKITQQLAKEKELRGDADEIRAQVNDLTEKYHKAKQQLEQCQVYRQLMKASLKTRRRNMFKITVSTGSRTKVFFTTLLHQRNYDGKLELDHDEHKLDIKVYPSSDKEAANRDLKGLSGGEKSFSTLCFMMSLWESVHSPFRCMDEFDVFMDMVNRRVSIKMLLEFAKGYPKHQFIFLTPQDTSQIDVNDYVHIFRMPDAARDGEGDGE